jgi:hypothetical protein
MYGVFLRSIDAEYCSLLISRDGRMSPCRIVRHEAKSLNPKLESWQIANCAPLNWRINAARLWPRTPLYRGFATGNQI